MELAKGGYDAQHIQCFFFLLLPPSHSELIKSKRTQTKTGRNRVRAWWFSLLYTTHTHIEKKKKTLIKSISRSW